MNDVELTVEQQTAAELLNLGPVVMATMAGGVLCIELRHSLYSWKWDKFLSRWIEITWVYSINPQPLLCGARLGIYALSIV